MYEQQNAESQARGTRGAEGSGGESPDYTDRETGASGNRSEYGDISQRIAGTVGARPVISNSVAGGILSQLIIDAEDRLGKVRACIDWYQVEEREQLERLQNLKRLQQLAVEGDSERSEQSEDQPE